MKGIVFNQAKWGPATNAYLNSIKTNLQCGKFGWADFIKAASKFKKPGRYSNGGDPLAALSSTSASRMDARALIADDSNDSDASGS